MLQCSSALCPIPRFQLHCVAEMAFFDLSKLRLIKVHPIVKLRLLLSLLTLKKNPLSPSWPRPDTHRQVRALLGVGWCVDVEIQAVLRHREGRQDHLYYLQTL